MWERWLRSEPDSAYASSTLTYAEAERERKRSNVTATNKRDALRHIFQMTLRLSDTEQRMTAVVKFKNGDNVLSFRLIVVVLCRLMSVDVNVHDIATGTALAFASFAHTSNEQQRLPFDE